MAFERYDSGSRAMDKKKYLNIQRFVICTESRSVRRLKQNHSARHVQIMAIAERVSPPFSKLRDSVLWVKIFEYLGFILFYLF
jgi:hypothetical protein